MKTYRNSTERWEKSDANPKQQNKTKKKEWYKKREKKRERHTERKTEREGKWFDRFDTTHKAGRKEGYLSLYFLSQPFYSFCPNRVFSFWVSFSLSFWLKWVLLGSARQISRVSLVMKHFDLQSRPTFEARIADWWKEEPQCTRIIIFRK